MIPLRSIVGRLPHLVAGLVVGGLVLLVAAAPARAQPPDSTRTLPMPSGAERWGHVAGEFLSPRFVVRSVATGTMAHLSEEPPSWGNDAGGFAARVASSAGGSLVYSTTEHGLAAMFHVDLRYVPLGEGGFGTRLGHAFVSSVTVRSRGGVWPNLPLAGGAVVSAVAQSAWETGSVELSGMGRTIAVALLVETASNVILEFR